MTIYTILLGSQYHTRTPTLRINLSTKTDSSSPTTVYILTSLLIHISILLLGSQYLPYPTTPISNINYYSSPTLLLTIVSVLRLLLIVEHVHLWHIVEQ